MSYFDDYDEYHDDFGDHNPECYHCGETCYWQDRKLYDFDINKPHICKDKMMAEADEFE